jgi:hypothetical protein
VNLVTQVYMRRSPTDEIISRLVDDVGGLNYSAGIKIWNIGRTTPSYSIVLKCIHKLQT